MMHCEGIMNGKDLAGLEMLDRNNQSFGEWAIRQPTCMTKFVADVAVDGG